MAKPKQYGIAVEDLPKGAIGMPTTIFEDVVEFEDLRQQILELKDANRNDEGEQQRD